MASEESLQTDRDQNLSTHQINVAVVGRGQSVRKMGAVAADLLGEIRVGDQVVRQRVLVWRSRKDFSETMPGVQNGAALQGVAPIMQASIQEDRVRRLRKRSLWRHRSAQMNVGNV
jgi:hypothetical protein